MTRKHMERAAGIVAAMKGYDPEGANGAEIAFRQIFSEFNDRFDAGRFSDRVAQLADRKKEAAG